MKTNRIAIYRVLRRTAKVCGILGVLVLFTKAADLAILFWFIAIISLIVAHCVKGDQCPHCGKYFVVKHMGKEDLGVCSSVYYATRNGERHAYEKHKIRYHWKCTSCGYHWFSEVFVDEEQLD